MRALLLAVVVLVQPAFAADVLIVAPKDGSAAYRTAVAAFEREWRPEDGTLAVSWCREVPALDGAKVVVALGGKAAEWSFGTARVIVALAPGDRSGDASRVHVPMTPSPKEFLAVLRRSAPGSKRLLVLRSGQAHRAYVEELRAVVGVGVPVIDDANWEEPARFPDELRALNARGDAIWMAPDPALVTPLVLRATAEYARVRGIPFFGPAPGLKIEGVSDSLAVPFGNSGVAAARAARGALAGIKIVEAYPTLIPPHEAVVVSTGLTPRR